MTPNDTVSSVPEDPEVQYDLSGNPLPPKPKPAIPPPNVHFAPAPPTGPVAFVPPPGYAPPGSAPAYSPRSSSKGTSGMTLYIGLGVGVLVLAGLIFGIRALKPALVAAPTAYSTYSAIDNSFTCDQPGGWTMHETGATSGNLATATFESGHARVRVVSDATGSLMGDIVGAGNSNLPPAQQVPAVQKLHMMDEKVLADDLPGYQESDPQPLQSSSGDARVSEWTATGGGGSSALHGYRVTILGNQREFTIICFCPERNWTALMPAFQRIIGSVKQGTGQ